MSKAGKILKQFSDWKIIFLNSGGIWENLDSPLNIWFMGADPIKTAKMSKRGIVYGDH